MPLILRKERSGEIYLVAGKFPTSDEWFLYAVERLKELGMDDLLKMYDNIFDVP